MTVHFDRYGITVHHGDCLDVLPELDDASVDAVCTDPPYGLEFMGREWDSFRQRDPRTAGRSGEGAVTGGAGIGTVDESLPSRPSGVLFDRDKKQARGVSYGGKRPMTLECDTCGVRSPIDKKHSSKAPDCAGTWVAVPMYPDAPSPLLPFQAWCQLWATECLRVLKPGGHLLAFGGTRTSHRLACAIEDAGFEIRDSIAWLYGSGFPKSLDVSKAIDKAAGVEREVVGVERTPWKGSDASITGVHGEAYRPTGEDGYVTKPITAPATDDARRWAGWGTALKPAHEPVVVARKPLAGTVAANVLEHGTGGLNIDGCRVGTEGGATSDGNGIRTESQPGAIGAYQSSPRVAGLGRWPANVVLDETQAATLDAQSGESVSHGGELINRGTALGVMNDDGWTPRETKGIRYPGAGGASRFFYTAKAPTAERARIPKVGAGEGRVTGLGGKIRECNVCGTRAINSGATELTCGHGDHRWVDNPRPEHIAHPTVKPLDLMRWLVRLVTPPGGLVLDPFAGSGTTAEACLLEGFRCIAIERETEYLPLIVHRINRRRDPVAAHIPDDALPSLFDLETP